MISDKLMTLTILLKQEWKKNRRSLRFRLSWILMLCIFICGTTAFVRQWQNTESEYEQYRKVNYNEYHGWTVTTYAVITQEYLLQPRLSSLIDPCSEQQLPSIFTYNAFLFQCVFGGEGDSYLGIPAYLSCFTPPAIVIKIYMYNDADRHYIAIGHWDRNLDSDSGRH